MLRTIRSRLVRFVALSLSAAATLGAQGNADTTGAQHATRKPVSIGNYPNVAGLRINFRDRALEQVRGINATIWFPHRPVTGSVRGLSLGLPATGAERVSGLALGIVGVSAERELRGITLAGIGAGSGGKVSGIALGGLGLAAGGTLNGIMAGGLGVGAGGSVRGVMVGGLGAATGGNMHGIVIGGLGAGVARDMVGIAIGGLGAGAAGNMKGIVLGGIGAGAGGNITGLAISGIGSGVGGTFKGIGVSGIAIGATRLQGYFAAPAVGAMSARGFILAPLLFRIQPDGDFRGLAVSGVNYVRGSQRGLTFGLFNYARALRGVQIGLLNVIATGTSHRILPLINWGKDTTK